MSSSAVRGGLLVALAALIGFLILRSVDDQIAIPVTEVTTVVAPTPTPTLEAADLGAAPLPEASEEVDLTTARDNSLVAVLVANGTEVDGQARRHTDTLRNLSFNVRPPRNAEPGEAQSIIYYRPGFNVEGLVVRDSLNASTVRVAPMPEPDPIVGDGVDLTGVDVFVLIGDDELAG